MTVGYLYNAAVNLLNKYSYYTTKINIETFDVSTFFRCIHQKKLILNGYMNLFTEFQPNESNC